MSNITVERRGNVAVVILDAPEVLNALSGDMVTELSASVDEVLAGDARALLLTGAGRAFCAGANLQGRDESPDDGKKKPAATTGSVLETHYYPLLNKLRHMDIPLVTAVNGVAAGVGMSFAIMGDLVVAARSAYFLQAFAKIGLVPDGGASYYLPRIIGWRRAMELSMLAERLPAEQALDWGLINRVVDDENMMTEAFALAERLANGPRSLGLIRQAYWDSLDNSFSDQLQLEARLQNQAGRTSDHREGVKAFLEKRDAQFQGQ